MSQQSSPGTPIFGVSRLLQFVAISIVFLADMIASELAHDVFPRAMVSPPNLRVPSNLGTHDPSRVIYDSGGYYFYSTSNDLTGWYTTDNGANWKTTPPIFPNGIPSEVHAACPTNDGHDIWAPDVIWNPNTNLFYVYYAVADWNNGTLNVIGLVTSPTLDPSKAVWTDRGIVIARTPTANAYNAIDPAPFFDPDGNMWLTLGSGYASTRDTAINVIALDKSTGLRSNSEVYSIQGCGCEASYIQPHGGYYYLFWNTGGCCSGASSTYLIHVARSTSVTGPYSGNTNFLASSAGVHGPGQIGIITLDDTDYYTYHYYPDSGGSVLGIGAIAWIDGWPNANGVAGDGGGSGGGESTTSKTTTTTSKPTTTSTNPAKQTQYGQCGGIGWTGPTACASPYTCQFSNPYYSQCL